MSRKLSLLLLLSLSTLISADVDIPDRYRDARSPMETQLNLAVIQINFPGLYDDVFAGIEGRIAGGVSADALLFPYQGLLYMIDKKNATYICGGSLITYSHMLTAAHCLYEFIEVSVYLGVTNRISGPAAFTQDVTDRGHWIIHESYTATGHTNDIALLFLSDLTPSLFEGKRVSLISLPSRDEARVDLVGMDATVAGFGSTSDTNKASDTLRFVTMPIISNQQCKSTFGSFVKDTNLCMSGQGGRSVCSGDSGGPLTVELTPGVITQVGIVSYGHKHGCTLGHPGVFTRVTSYLDWIERHAGPLGPVMAGNNNSTNNSSSTTERNRNGVGGREVSLAAVVLGIFVKFMFL